jgi:hypothetical protein
MARANHPVRLGEAREFLEAQWRRAHARTPSGKGMAAQSPAPVMIWSLRLASGDFDVAERGRINAP